MKPYASDNLKIQRYFGHNCIVINPFYRTIYFTFVQSDIDIAFNYVSIKSSYIDYFIPNEAIKSY